MDDKHDISKHPLATEDIGKLIMKFSIPAIVSMLVGALYNIVDQIFIGQSVGMRGNAATNVAFPLTTISTAIALFLGVGSASNFNLKLGAGKREDAGYIAGNGIGLLIISGIILSVIVRIFLEPLISAFGATEEIFDYAMIYTGITSIGIPFLVFSTGASTLIRADGSPAYAMISVMTGAVINVILDYIFIFIFNMGMAGAAWATVIGQIASSLMIVRYLLKFKTINLTKKYFKIKRIYALAIGSLGLASFFNQIAMTLVQITMNNTLTHYGALSRFGSEVPLASVGIISKVNIVFMSFVIGIAIGCQPINGFNYGAKNYDRVKQTYKIAVIITTSIATTAFLLFQIFPRQIIGIFGEGSPEYFEFATRYMRIFMLFTFINGIQPVTSSFFTSIGKATKGLVLSMTRQIIFLIPLLLIFPTFFGVEGVMYAGPIADIAAAIVSILFISYELKYMGANEIITEM